MRLRDLVPTFAKDWWRITATRLRCPDCIVHTPLVAPGARIGHHVWLGRDVTLASAASIGDRSYVNDRTAIGAASIGRFCSVAYNCCIGLHEHPLDRVSTSPHFYGSANLFGRPASFDDLGRPTVVEDDVWLGSNVVVVQGVNIGVGAVVAAGAVVTHDVAPYTIVGGIPARTIRMRFPAEIVDALLASRWWEWSDEELRANERLFLDPGGLGEVAARYVPQATPGGCAKE